MQALLVVASATILLGCGGPPLGDLTGGEVLVSLSGVASTPETVAIGESSGGLAITQAYVRASSLSLLPCRERAADLVLSARGYDLLAVPPPSELVSTAVTELCGLRLDIDPLTQNLIDAVPEDTSVYLAGTDAAGTPFSFTSTRSWSLLLEGDADASFGEVPLLLGFDVSKWLAGLPLLNDINGTQALFEMQLRAAVALYVDQNENGALDADEQTPVALPAPAR